MADDRELLQIYILGFRDELNGKSLSRYSNDIEQRAYNLGSIHAIVGDEISAIDYLSDDEILNLIKKKL